MRLAAVMQEALRDKEGWKYTSLRGLQDAGFVPAAAGPVRESDLPARAAADGQRLVFVNGVLDAALSDRVDLLSGDAAGGYALTVGDQVCLATAPLELLFVAAKRAQAQECAIKLTITLGAHARLTLLERHVSAGAGAAVAVLAESSVTLGAQAKLLHMKFQGLQDGDYHLARGQVRLAKGAYYDWFGMALGAALSRESMALALTEPQAQVRLHGVAMLRGAQHGDLTTVVRHQAPDTSSLEQYRGVLDGKARGVFQGKIIVAPGAQKTDGQQMSRSLLLSDLAEANSKPELEIYADDVKCSHGATVGQLDNAALFYLRSRGVPEATARAMLVEGFIAEAIEALGSEAGRALALAEAARWHVEGRHEG